MSLISIKFKGIDNVKEVYRGDGLVLNAGETADVEIHKAAQVLKDFPDEFELVGITDKEFSRIYDDYQDRMVASAASRKGIRVLDEFGNEMFYPAGSTVTVAPPKQSASDRMKKAHRCELEGCKVLTKKNRKYCRKHGAEDEKN